jgi:hypothetical protein
MLKPLSKSAVETLATIPGPLAQDGVKMWRAPDIGESS